jgi:hypothetical protein
MNIIKLNMPHIILVCGYRRTGKDAFYNILTGKDTEHHWLIYKHSSNNKSLNHGPDLDKQSFANALKQECFDLYSIPLEILDVDKDKRLFDGRSARDYYILHAALRKQQSIDYWCSKLEINSDTMITDWRFNHELEYIGNRHNTTTIRLYRSCVFEPAADITSEHELDLHLTDMLLVTNEDDFTLALQRFPQYQGYTFAGMI